MKNKTKLFENRQKLEKKNTEVITQLVEMRAKYQQIMNSYKETENINREEGETGDETTTGKKSDRLKIAVSNLVKREFEKLQLSERIRKKKKF